MKRKRIIALPILLLAMLVLYQGFFASPPTMAQAESDYKSIRVFGESVISAPPDEATVVLAVETHGDTATEAGEENARLVDKLLEALKKHGLKEEQIETGRYRVNSYQDYYPTREGKEEGKIYYRAYNQVKLTLKNLEEVGKIIDLALANGANQVQSIQFGVKDPQALYLKALEQATKQARAKADAIAKGAGVTIKGIKNITEERTNYIPYRASLAQDAAAAEKAAPTTPIIPGEVEVSAIVVVEYIF